MAKIQDTTLLVPKFRGIFSKDVQERLLKAFEMKGDKFKSWNFIIGVFLKMKYSIPEMIEYCNLYCHYSEYSVQKTVDFIISHPNYRSGYPPLVDAPKNLFLTHPRTTTTKLKKQDCISGISAMLDFFFESFKPQPEFENSSDILESAILHYQHGFHIFPVGEDKRPVGRWRNGIIDYTDFPLNPAILKKGVLDHGFACLGTSKHTFLDVDLKNDKHENGVTQSEIEKIMLRFRGWHMERSKNGGLHIWGIGDLSLYDVRACFTASDAEISVKGRGSYIVVYPSPGYSIIV